MTNATQTEFIKAELIRKGEISRNFALRNYISRLGALIYNLKQKGWVFECEYIKTAHGKDFVYKLIEKGK